MTHPHAPPVASPGTDGFLRGFGLTLGLLLAGIAGFTALVDPLGRFGTGVLAPVIAADRDQKAALYRRRDPRPATVVLGSSRSKTIPPAELTRLGAGPAFNFAVNGAAPEDLLAIARYLAATGADSVRLLLVGLDPEMLQPGAGVHRPLASSRILSRYAPTTSGGTLTSLGADLLGWQAVSAAVRSVNLRLRQPSGLAETAIDADGRQQYPRVEALRAAGRFNAQAAVDSSLGAILARYQSFGGLDSVRVAWFVQFLSEARAAGRCVVVFVPPVHPRFAARAAGTAWAARTEEAVQLLLTLERAGQLEYRETRDLAREAPEASAFIDAIHFLEPLARRIAERLLSPPMPCAVQ